MSTMNVTDKARVSCDVRWQPGKRTMITTYLKHKRRKNTLRVQISRDCAKLPVPPHRRKERARGQDAGFTQPLGEIGTL